MNRIALISSLLILTVPSVSTAIEQTFNIEGDVKSINNTENNYQVTNNTVTVDNKKYQVFIDKKNQQYYKIEGKYVPIINTEINNKR